MTRTTPPPVTRRCRPSDRRARRTSSVDRTAASSPRLLALIASLVLTPVGTIAAETVRIGSTDRLSHAILSLARSDTVELLPVTTGDGDGSALDALAQGDVDLLAIGADALLDADERGLALRGALVLGYAGTGDVLLGEPALRSVAALRGTRIGNVSGRAGRLLVAAELQRRGLDSNDVDLIDLSLADALAGWADPSPDTRLDALTLATPSRQAFLAALADDAREPVVITRSGRPPGLLGQVLAGEDRWLRRNKETVKEVIRAWDRALLRLRRGDADALAALGARLQLDPETLSDALGKARLFSVDENIALLRGEYQKAFSSMSEVRARTRSDGARGVPSANRYLDLSALRQVAAGR